MRVVVMGRNRFYVRGLVEELTDGGVEVVASVRTLNEMSTIVAAAAPEALLVCLPAALADARACALAVTSVLAERPGAALLALTAVPTPAAMLRPLGSVRWEVMAMEPADPERVLGALRRLIAAPVARRTPRSDGTLTACEQRVLDLLAVGLSNEAIARRLGVSLKTVESHVSRAFDKLGLAGADHTRNRRVLAALRWSGM